MPRVQQLLEELSNSFGPSGFEGPVREIVKREMLPLTDTVETDGIGSLIGRLGKSDGSPKIMLAGHMDEVGLIVRYVTPEGYVKFQTLGGWLDQALINQRWTILTKNGPVHGITGIKTPHVMAPEARNQVFKREQMFLDVGAESKEDAEERLGICPGDPIAPDSAFQVLGGGKLYLGKAWDDRVGVALMLEVLRELQNQPLESTIYAVATVQEEIGLRGAHTSANRVAPDIGVNFESGVAGDYPGITQDEAQEKVGEGPSVFLHDSSMLPNLKLRDFVLDVAKDLGIHVQFNVLSGYGQDGAEMQKAHSGAPAINIAIPTRYLHSHNSIISRSDFDQAVVLSAEILRRLDDLAVKNIRSFD